MSCLIPGVVKKKVSATTKQLQTNTKLLQNTISHCTCHSVVTSKYPVFAFNFL